MKKKTIITLITILVLLCAWGIRSIRNNYQLGQDLYVVLNRLSIQYENFANTVDRLKEVVDEGGVRGSHLTPLYNSLYEFWSSIGYDDMPFWDDVRHEWYQQFNKYRLEAIHGDEHIIGIFADEEKFKELAHLRDQSYHVVDCFGEFRENYEQMSVWERYFTSWKDEQKILNEKVRFTPLSE